MISKLVKFMDYLIFQSLWIYILITKRVPDISSDNASLLNRIFKEKFDTRKYRGELTDREIEILRQRRMQLQKYLSPLWDQKEIKRLSSYKEFTYRDLNSFLEEKKETKDVSSDD